MPSKIVADEKPYYGDSSRLVPKDGGLEAVANAAKGCQACHLWRHATQTVFGEGSVEARVVMVGEQPGDKEDLVGRPFVGPAGEMLDQCLEEAGIDRRTIYITNVVKHFKWVGGGGRRLHKKPNRPELLSCLPWLLKEFELIRPELIVCLGASSAQALMGAEFRLTKHRGELIQTHFGAPVLATLHPSAILRAPDHETRQAKRLSLVEDLKLVASQLG